MDWETKNNTQKPGQNTGTENDITWSDIGSGYRELGPRIRSRFLRHVNILIIFSPYFTKTGLGPLFCKKYQCVLKRKREIVFFLPIRQPPVRQH